jgi:hypothetical protein
MALLASLIIPHARTWPREAGPAWGLGSVRLASWLGRARTPNREMPRRIGHFDQPEGRSWAAPLCGDAAIPIFQRQVIGALAQQLEFRILGPGHRAPGGLPRRTGDGVSAASPLTRALPSLPVPRWLRVLLRPGCRSASGRSSRRPCRSAAPHASSSSVGVAGPCPAERVVAVGRGPGSPTRVTPSCPSAPAAARPEAKRCCRWLRRAGTSRNAVAST